MFQLESVDPRRVSDLNVIVIVIIIELIDDPYPERVGVPKSAVVNAGYVEVTGETEITFRFQDGIYLYKALAYEIPFAAIIRSLFPERIIPVLVFYWRRPGIIQQVGVGYRQFYFATMLTQIMP